MEAMEKTVNLLQHQSRRLYENIEKISLNIGDKCDMYMIDTTARRKYWCEVLLRVPLIFIIHQWLLISPYSNYWMIDVVLFVVRYGVALLLMGTWALNSGVLLQAYINLSLDIGITWIKHVDYWTSQDNAYEICSEQTVFVWSDVADDSQSLLRYSVILQLPYLCTRLGAFCHRWKENCSFWVYIGIFSTLVPKFLSSLGVAPAFTSELSYWIDSTLLVITILLEVTSLMDEDGKVDEKKFIKLNIRYNFERRDGQKLKYKSDIEILQRRIENRKTGKNFADRLPGKWFVRDTILIFGVNYLFLLLLIEVTFYQMSITSIVTTNKLIEIGTMWCTTHVIVVFISYCFGLLSNVTVALSHWFLTKEVNIVEAFDANIGGIVQFVAIITFTEANVLSLENFEKMEVMKLIAFLSTYAVIFQTLDVLEQKILQAINSGISPGILFYVRAVILSGLLVTIPSLSTLILSKSLGISTWLLFFASGNCTLLLRIFSLFLECALIKATWYSTNHLSKLEDGLHYTRVCKSLALVVINCAQCYCRYICPFFKGWWFLRLCLALFNFVAVAGVLGWNEFDRYKTRNTLFTLLNKLQDVSYHKEEEESEDTPDCAICYLEMTQGKKLPCNHVFHKECLRKWFQVRSVCPMCNTDIRTATGQGLNQGGQ